jgi:capsular polysaccharide transport system permease protein
MHKRQPLQIQKAVLHALLIREMKTRFGQYRLGMAWAVLEPLFNMLFFFAMYTMGGRTGIGGLAIPVFLVTGLVPFFFFREMVGQMMNAVQANQSLFIYRQVRIFDTYLCRFLLETGITISVMIIMLTAAWWFDYDVNVHNFLLLVGTFLLLALFSLGLGMLFGTINRLHPEAGKLIQPILRPLFFISGVFFSINSIPSNLQPYLLWNPILHALEFMRSAMSSSYDTSLVSLNYLAMATLVALCLGMLSLRANWRRMLAT